jgi:hypothetical protein
VAASPRAPLDLVERSALSRSRSNGSAPDLGDEHRVRRDLLWNTT